MKSIKVNPDGVTFEIVLDDFVPGSSFFYPCNNIVYGKDEVTRRLRRLGFKKIVIEERIENNRMGLRVWRKA